MMPVDWGWGWSWFGMLFMALFWVAIILLVVWAVKQFEPDRWRRRPLEILEERFARGEIDVEEFESRRRELERR